MNLLDRTMVPWTLGPIEQEGLAGSSCRCLRKIVDRQSRWRPRELQFEQMEVGVEVRRLEQYLMLEVQYIHAHSRHLRRVSCSQLLCFVGCVPIRFLDP